MAIRNNLLNPGSDWVSENPSSADVNDTNNAMIFFSARAYRESILNMIRILNTSINISLLRGLVSYWKFDENTGTTVNDSVGSINGTISGATWTTSGKINNALNYGTTSNAYYTTFGNVYSDLFVSNNYSIGLWVYSTSTSNDMMIVSKWYSSGYGNNSFIIYPNNFVTNGSATSFTRIPNNEWVHIVVTVAAGVATVYVNGTSIASSAGHSSVASSYPLYVGKHFVNNSYNFSGLIDEVFIYDRAISAIEVSRLYNSNKGTQHPFADVGSFLDGLKGEWCESYENANGLLSSVDIVNTTCSFEDFSYKFDGTGLIVHSLPSGTFQVGETGVFVTPKVVDWEDGADIQFKLTANSGAEETPWLDVNKWQTFTALTNEPDTLVLKLVPKTVSPTSGYPSVSGCGLITKHSEE